MSESVSKVPIIIALLLAISAGCLLVFSNPSFELTGQTFVKSAEPLSVALHETTWDNTDSDEDGIADCATLILQESHLSISPVVENTSSVSGWVYLTVDTPTTTEGQPACTYSVEPGWILLDSSCANNRCQKTFAFESTVEAGKSTPVLFGDLVYQGSQAEDSGTYIELRAAAIQSEHIPDPEAGWELFVKKAGAADEN